MNAIVVVIVTYQGQEWIRSLLESILNNSMQSSIIVVDNASSDDTSKIVREEFPSVTLIQLSKNLGFGAGNNIGIAHALASGCEYIFLANQDGVVPADSIKSLYSFMTHNPAYGVASPLHCSPDLDHIDRKTYTGFLSPYGYDYFSDTALGNTPKTGYPIHGINAAAWFVRTEVFRKVGGFDPLFFMYGEDDDLIARLAFHKVGFALVPSARFLHLRKSPSTTSASFRARLRKGSAMARSSLLAKLKQPGISTLFGVLILISAGIMKPLSEFMIKRNIIVLFANVRAVAGLLVELPAISRHRRICEKTGPHFLTTTASEIT